MAAQKNEGKNWKEKALNIPRNPRTSRILAKSFYKELKSNGFSRNEILAVSSEILSLVTSDIKQNQA